MSAIRTIGYEGANLADFLETLTLSGVTTLVDVRDVAVSRRPGFSKTALSNALREAGIEYRHLRALGDPKDGREAARAGYYSTFRAIFGRRLATPAAQVELQQLVEIASGREACLMCFEADATNCHRSLIVDALQAQMPLQVEHLKVFQTSAGTILRTSSGPGQSRAAA